MQAPIASSSKCLFSCGMTTVSVAQLYQLSFQGAVWLGLPQERPRRTSSSLPDRGPTHSVGSHCDRQCERCRSTVTTSAIYNLYLAFHISPNLSSQDDDLTRPSPEFKTKGTPISFTPEPIDELWQSLGLRLSDVAPRSSSTISCPSLLRLSLRTMLV